ncbi:unnamed protein product [Acanthoscelides obtectus]|uniref:Uncharacterized protein n=1 Tax=Acanthoscelides obtectus TaxID=200917 RepID=A0A9P0LLP0_ACAOB|nr:unnamed protein product [Acanthoscelides obtectus]CAK1665549.1 hypothetical protein AOBTE_LOCUS24877 [Acanthoscelides obtectus]
MKKACIITVCVHRVKPIPLMSYVCLVMISLLTHLLLRESLFSSLSSRRPSRSSCILLLITINLPRGSNLRYRQLCVVPPQFTLQPYTRRDYATLF